MLSAIKSPLSSPYFFSTFFNRFIAKTSLPFYFNNATKSPQKLEYYFEMEIGMLNILPLTKIYIHSPKGLLGTSY